VIVFVMLLGIRNAHANSCIILEASFVAISALNALYVTNWITLWNPIDLFIIARNWLSSRIRFIVILLNTTGLVKFGPGRSRLIL
jgi:hypothetical protein